MQRSDAKNWIKIGEVLFNLEDIVMVRITPANELWIDVKGAQGTTVITDLAEITEFKTVFKEHARKRGDTIIGI